MDKVAVVIRGSHDLINILTNNSDSTKRVESVVKYQIKALSPISSGTQNLQMKLLQEGTISTKPTEHKKDLFTHFFTENQFRKDQEASELTSRELFIAVLIPFFMSITVFCMAFCFCGSKLNFSSEGNSFDEVELGDMNMETSGFETGGSEY